MSGYAYVANRPMTHVDLDGREDEMVVSGRKMTGKESAATVKAIVLKDSGYVVTGTITWHHGAWHVTGLRGTGSQSFLLENVFVPHDHAVHVSPTNRREPGPHRTAGRVRFAAPPVPRAAPGRAGG